MSRVDKWTLTAIVVFLGVVLLPRVWWDFHHPEDWSPGSGNDPHVYLWAWAAVGVFAACIALRMVIPDRNDRRRARLKALLVRAEVLVRQHRREEAAAVLKECESLLSKMKST